MGFVRFLMLLSLVVWIGGIVFFAFVVAPTVFHPGILPAYQNHQIAGNVVNRSLTMLHWMGIGCGVIFATTSMITSYAANGVLAPFAARNLLVYLMIVLTLISMFGVGARMAELRRDMGVIDEVPVQDARRMEFNRLHIWSTRLESSVLVLGLALLYLTARHLS